MRRGTHALGTALAAVVNASGLSVEAPRILLSQDAATYPVTAVRSSDQTPLHVDSLK